MKTKIFLCKAQIALLLLLGQNCLNDCSLFAQRQDTIKIQQKEIVRNILTNVECSDIPHKGKATISWITVNKSFQNPQIDYTVFKSGFESGQFKVLYPLNKGTKSKLNPEFKFSDKVKDRIPDLFILDASNNKDSNRDILTIDGLDPGLTYFLRIKFQIGETISSKIFRVVGPICPSDDFRDKK